MARGGWSDPNGSISCYSYEGPAGASGSGTIDRRIVFEIIYATEPAVRRFGKDLI